MGRAGIRYEDVEQAAESLSRAHVNPTHERIRQALGGGSYSTIGRHLQTWRLAQAEEGTAVEAMPPDTLVDAVKGVWQGMRGAADVRIAEAEAQAAAALEAVRVEAEERVATAAAAAQAREAEAAAAADAQVRQAQEQAQVQRYTATRLQDSLREATHQIETLRAALQQAAADQAEAHGRTEARAQEAIALRQAQNACQARAAAQAEASQKALVDALAQAAEQHAVALEGHKQQCRTELVAQQAAATAERDRLIQAHTEAVHTLEAGGRADRAAAAEVAAELAHLRPELQAAEDKAAALQSQLTASEAARQLAQQRMADAEATLQMLRGEAQGRTRVLEEVREAFNMLAGHHLAARGPHR